MVRDTKTVDVAIIGGGPAGAAAAISLARRGIDVRLFERTRYEGFRLGETIPPGIRHPLAELGLWESFLETNPQPSFANLSCWGSPEIYSRDSIFNPLGNGWHIDRNKFDRMLNTGARLCGARVEEGAAVLSINRVSSGWELVGRHNSEQFSLSARFLIDASGRRSSIAAKIQRRRVYCDKLIGLAAFLDRGSVIEEVSALLLEAAEDGWWYSAPLPDGRLAAVYMTDSDLCPRGEAGDISLWISKLERAPHTTLRLQGYQRPQCVTVRPADTSFMEEPAGDGFLAVGDSAMAVDPLSSQGIYRALGSGIQGAEVIAGVCSGKAEAFQEYNAELRSEFDEYFERRAGYYGLEGRWPEAPFWKRRQHLGSATSGPEKIDLARTL